MESKRGEFTISFICRRSVLSQFCANQDETSGLVVALSHCQQLEQLLVPMLPDQTAVSRSHNHAYLPSSAT